VKASLVSAAATVLVALLERSVTAGRQERRDEIWSAEERAWTEAGDDAAADTTAQMLSVEDGESGALVALRPAAVERTADGLASKDARVAADKDFCRMPLDAIASSEMGASAAVRIVAADAVAAKTHASTSSRAVKRI
jgi:hypothetical protein